MKQLLIFRTNNGGSVEFREGATGFSIEVNQHQVFWTSIRSEAERLFYKLGAALEAE